MKVEVVKTVPPNVAKATGGSGATAPGKSPALASTEAVTATLTTTRSGRAEEKPPLRDPDQAGKLAARLSKAIAKGESQALLAQGIPSSR